MRTRFAVLNFKGATATWLQTIQRCGRIHDWDQLCNLVLAKFDKDQYQIILHQLDSLKQTTSILEYQTEFEKLAHGVLLYNSAIDDTFFMTRFVGGLREDIRSPILLHRPKDVDTASALALIQEQELENMSGRGSSKGVSKSNKSYEIVKPGNQKLKTKGEEQLATLKAFRRRNGLFFKCGEKWNPGHKCPPHVSLHVLEELLEAMEIDGAIEEEDSDVELPAKEQEVLTVQETPKAQAKHMQTMKFLAQIGKHQVLVLVDSGSIGTFVSNHLVAQLKLKTVDCEPSTFRAADGGLMLCDQKVPQLQWFI